MSNFWKKLKKPITVLAPMDDVTDVVFREILATTAKPDVLFTEFTSIDGMLSKGKERVEKRLMYTETQRPIVAQIWGNDPQKFLEASKRVEELGFDGIDINMGCPDKSVMKKGCGAGLICKNNLVGEIINAVKEGAPNIPLSVKTRLGKDKTATTEWLNFLLSQNIQVLTLHARDAKSASKVPANWDEIGNAVDLKNKLNPEIILIGNGDVKSFGDVVEKQKLYGIDGAMIGRGVFSNPWVFERNKITQEHSIEEHLNLLLNHAKLFNDTWNKTKNFEILKKFFKIYVKGFNGADALRIELMAARSHEEVVNIINNTKLLSQ